MRRTELRRKTPLRSKPGPKALDFSAETKRIIRERAGGRCEAGITAECRNSLGRPWFGHTFNHRQKRSQGGPGVVANGMYVCGDGTRGCHGWIEAHWEESRKRGWTVRRCADFAAQLMLVADGRWVQLTADGGYREVFDADGRPVMGETA